MKSFDKKVSLLKKREELLKKNLKKRKTQDKESRLDDSSLW
mgnify:CR=1 FL=1